MEGPDAIPETQTWLWHTGIDNDDGVRVDTALFIDVFVGSPRVCSEGISFTLAWLNYDTLLVRFAKRPIPPMWKSERHRLGMR